MARFGGLNERLMSADTLYDFYLVLVGRDSRKNGNQFDHEAIKKS
jgi:hypothetical protein